MRNSPSRSVAKKRPLPSRAKLRSDEKIGCAGLAPSAGSTRRFAAGREVHHPDVRLVDRDELEHREAPVVEREREIAPAGAGQCGELARLRRIERVDEREIERRVLALARLVDVGRFDQHVVARMRDGADLVLAIGVGEQHRRRAPRREAIELLLLVAAGIAGEDQRVRRLRPERPASHRFCEVGDLHGLVAGLRDAMKLRHVAGAAGDDELALRRMPAHRVGGPELRVGRDSFGERRRNRRNPLGLEVGIRGDDVGREGGSGEPERERGDGQAMRGHE